MAPFSIATKIVPVLISAHAFTTFPTFVSVSYVANDADKLIV